MNSHEPMSAGNGEQDDAEATAMLEPFRGTLRSVAVWEDPPADLGDRIVSQVNTLRAAASSTDPSAPTPTPTPPPPASLDEERRRRHGRGWLWPGLAVAAAAVVAFAAGALLTGGDDDQRSRESVADVELSPTDLGGEASAAGSVIDAGAGYAINIDVTGLAPAPEGQYYEGWLHDTDSGDWVSVGTFHMRGGDDRVVLWSGVPIARYQQLVVTSEVEGSTGGGHGDVLLEGQLQRR